MHRPSLDLLILVIGFIYDAFLKNDIIANF
ncbi:hypothetical protein N748_13690 [Legionella pneumophila str. 121004]|nr:hypothetical protein N748_13690 [Legionella pneumophila str. 121004]ERH45408.1 hypothetical protein N751_11230 [Legionella pneumophila str. Leg01/11]